MAVLRTLNSMGLGGGGSSAPVQGSVVLTPGTSTWTVPAGVYRIFAVLWGGGGGGARHNTSGSGGMGGAITMGYLNVTPGQAMPYTVGLGGAGWTNTAAFGNGSVGEDTTFGGLVAKGGTGGKDGAANIGSNATVYVANSGQVISNDGGNSPSKSGSPGSGGGGAAGPGGPGSSPAAGAGGAGGAANGFVPAGGAGGNGINAAAAVPGVAPGGGGGTASGAGSTGTGAVGGAGQLIIYW